MFNKDTDSITGQEGNQLAYDAIYIDEGVVKQNPITDEYKFFMGYRFVDTETGKTFQGKENSISAEIIHVTNRWDG